MPGPRHAGIDRREAVQRHQDGRTPCRHALVDHLVDAAMIGIEDRAPTLLGGFARQSLVAGYDRGFAEQRDRACGPRRAVAVDDEPRIALRDQMRAEHGREPLGDPGDADVPGDVPYELALGPAEIAEPFGDQAAIMIAGKQERRVSARVLLEYRRYVVNAEKHRCFA